jgi:hypothetical protein
MNELCYCLYAFALPKCRVEEIGPGVDPRFQVELIREGPIAAITSRVGLDQFAPERLQGKTAEDIQWLSKMAVRHNEIICQASASSAVLPLRLGTVFHSRDSMRAVLARCAASVAEFLKQLGNRQEWGVKLYLGKLRLEPIPGHTGPPPPHFLGPQRTGTAYLTQKKAQLDDRREQRADVHRTIQNVEQRLAGKAENSCRIRNLPTDLTGRAEEMVFNGAFLLPSSAQAAWLEAIKTIDRDVKDKGLVLELSGPWPPYHFCPSLQL